MVVRFICEELREREREEMLFGIVPSSKKLLDGDDDLVIPLWYRNVGDEEPVVGEACVEDVCRSNGFGRAVDIGCGRGREKDTKRRRGRNSICSRYVEGDGGRELTM
jgi:hypothetical protein